MDTLNASERLAALGHENRLSIFRLLVAAGPEGLAAGVIGERLEIPAATLSFHLSHLARVGLVASRQQSRFKFYSADFTAMDELIAFLTDNCCAGGAPCLPKTATVRTSALRRARSELK